MNKRTWIYSLAFCGLAGATLWLNQGCAGKIAPLAAIVQPVTPMDSTDIQNFETQLAGINPSLLGVQSAPWNAATPGTGSEEGAEASSGIGSWAVATYGGSPQNTINGGAQSDCNRAVGPCFIQIIPPAMANPASFGNFAAHVFGPLNTTTGGYEAHQFKCRFRSDPSQPYFDASSFSGIRFHFYRSSADTNTAPVFQVAIDLTTPPSEGAGGTCAGASCYNHYQAGLTGGPDDAWQVINLPWASIAFPGFGTSHGPHIGSCVDSVSMLPCADPLQHLKKILFFQYQFSNNTATGGVFTNTDYWLDNVEFF